MILLGSAAVAVGAFTIARRTLDTLGNDITDLPLTAAIVVACVSSGIVISLSAVGIPASFVIIATMSIVGLGWGRATRTVTVKQGISGEKEPKVSVGALKADETGPIGEGDPSDIPSASDLFNPGTSARVVLMQNVVPLLSTVGASSRSRSCSSSSGKPQDRDRLPTEPPLSILKVKHRPEVVPLSEVPPVHIGKVEFGVHRLPDGEVREPLGAGFDHEIGLFREHQPVRDVGGSIDSGSRSPASTSTASSRTAAANSAFLPSPTVIRIGASSVVRRAGCRRLRRRQPRRHRALRPPVLERRPVEGVDPSGARGRASRRQPRRHRY